MVLEPHLLELVEVLLMMQWHLLMMQWHLLLMLQWRLLLMLQRHLLLMLQRHLLLMLQRCCWRCLACLDAGWTCLLPSIHPVPAVPVLGFWMLGDH